jgi:GNAT superfamily N-acetyltransferase
MAILLKMIAATATVESPLLRKRAEESSRTKYTEHYIAYDEGREIGFISLDVRPGTDYVVLYELIVEPSLRRLGIGTALVAEVEKITRGLGRPRIILMPEPFMLDIGREALVAWYERLGFRRRQDLPQEMEKYLVSAP